MLRVNKLLQSIVILLTAVSFPIQAEDESIEFSFEKNEGSTLYNSTCHNFTVERQLSLVTIGVLNKTDGFQQCFCSLRATYETSNVTIQVDSGENNAEYWLEDNSTITIKLTYSETIINGYLYLEEEGIGYLPADGVIISADGGVLDMMCNNVSYQNFTFNQLTPTTEAPSTSSSDSDSEEKLRTENTNNNIPVIPLAAAIAGIVVIAICVTGAVVYQRRRRKSVKGKEDQNEGIQYADINITSLAPRNPKAVAKEEAEARAKLEASSTTAITYADIDFNAQHGVYNPSLSTEGMEYERVDAVKKQGGFSNNTGDFSPYETHDQSAAFGDNGRRQTNLPMYAQVVKDAKKKKL